jgi:hypothetical protein
MSRRMPKLRLSHVAKPHGFHPLYLAIRVAILYQGG